MGAYIFMSLETLNSQIFLNSGPTEVAYFTLLNASPPMMLEDDTQALRDNTHSLQELSPPPLLQTRQRTRVNSQHNPIKECQAC